ncbi:MAG: hypothetical protein FJ254_08610 [Phycisphaerae bacterium]|nr:hypothetical protein [Phycisphaerae bacterium]
MPKLPLAVAAGSALALSTAVLVPEPVQAKVRSAHDLSRKEVLALIDQVVTRERAGSQPPQRATTASFWNWETPHVHPIDLTPDRSMLLAVNLADGVLELFDVTGTTPARLGSVPVGVDPVSVRARSNTEAWVVNHLSDTISIIDLPTRRVRATLSTGDEPCDVVFAGSPLRAFVSVSQLNEVRVFDPANLATSPTVLSIQGEDPRALATDGTRVYAAIFESGNATTMLSEAVVSSSANPYAGDPNPPPNSGTGFNPPLTSGLPTAPRGGLIVRKQADGTWRDDNNGNWTSSVTWGLHDQDLAIINASTLATTYAKGLMTTNMALDVGPSGRVTVVGTEATNLTRFEPLLKGTFIRVRMASVDPAAPTTPTIVDLNPHLNYTTGTLPQAQRDLSIGDPRAIIWNAARTTGWVAGMGSNNVLQINASGVPQARIEVGEGPTGLALDESRGALYVMNKFDGSISRVSMSGGTETARVAFHDSTPVDISAGRPFLYDTHRTSGLGQASCGSCHIDGKLDFIGWDLGDPSGSVKTFNQNCNFGLAGGCANWHPMKGPMTTQTLVGIFGAEPLHWRGDREGLPAFNGAFVGLVGDDTQLTQAEMTAFVQFVATMRFPPNPNRNIDNSLKTSLAGSGNPSNGQTLFNTLQVDGAATNCAVCHRLPTGGLGVVISANLLQEPQSMKIPQLQNLHEKTGFLKTSQTNNRGFAFTHDGGFDTLINFLNLGVFSFASGSTGQQQRRDLEAFMFSLATDTHAAVGQQVTLTSLATATPAQLAMLDTLASLAANGNIDLIAKGNINGQARGWMFLSTAEWQSDRAVESATTAQLRAMAAPGSEITFTAVPDGTGIRLGYDRDLDGFADRDELDAGSDPADPTSVPQLCTADLTQDGVVNGADLGFLLGAWGACSGCAADLNDDGSVDGADLGLMLGAWGGC